MSVFYICYTARRGAAKRVKIGETGRDMNTRLMELRSKYDKSLQVSTLCHVGTNAERKALEATVRLALERAGYSIVSNDFITWYGANNKQKRVACIECARQAARQYCELLNIRYTEEAVDG